jgi:hypothetical protein
MKLLNFWTLPITLVFMQNTSFRHWILSPSSGKSLLSWAESIELLHISGHGHQHKIGHVNQTQNELSARVKTNINSLKNYTYMRPSTYGQCLLYSIVLCFYRRVLNEKEKQDDG